MSATEGYRSGSGEAVVLVHGFAGSWHNWDPVLELLTEHHDVLAVALRGHSGGRPLAPGVQVGTDAMVDAVEEDMDAAGLRTAHLVGNSLGGRLALELARRGRARSVVAFSPAIWWPEGPHAAARARVFFAGGHWISARLMAHIGAFVRRPRLRRVLMRGTMQHGDRVRPAVAANVVRANVDCPIYFDLFEAMLREGPPRSLEVTGCPVLVVWSAKDRTLPGRRHATAARRLLPEADYVELPGAGHVPTFDDPVGVAALITDFVARSRVP